MNLRYCLADGGKPVMVQDIPTYHAVKIVGGPRAIRHVRQPNVGRQVILRQPSLCQIDCAGCIVGRIDIMTDPCRALRCVDRRRSRGPITSAASRQTRLPRCDKTDRRQSPGLVPDFFHPQTVRSMTPRFCPSDLFDIFPTLCYHRAMFEKSKGKSSVMRFINPHHYRNSFRRTYVHRTRGVRLC